MSQKQEEYAQSLATQLITVWSKLGGSAHDKAAEYASWGENTIHALLYRAKKTKVLRSSFGPTPACDYTAGELKVCIAHLLQVLQGYKSMWQKQWQGEAADRQALLLEDERIAAECYPYERAMEWLRVNSSAFKLEERFVFVKKIGTVNFYAMRDKPVKLYTYLEGKRMLEQMAPGADFEELFEVAEAAGFSGLFKAKFEMGVKR